MKLISIISIFYIYSRQHCFHFINFIIETQNSVCQGRGKAWLRQGVARVASREDVGESVAASAYSSGEVLTGVFCVRWQERLG
jgi:hypothetical protein